MRISSIVITRNEEENIADCINNLSFVDEIIVVDNGSSDKTVEVAKSLGAKVYKSGGIDFSFLRNIGKEKAGSPWLLYIDADERVTKELSSEIKLALKDSGQYSAFSILRKNYYLGRPWPKIEKITRLIKKEALIGWQGSLHETPIIAGNIGNLKNFLLHDTHRDLASMLRKTNEWSEIEAHLRFQSGHRRMTWWRFFRVMCSSFCQSYILDGGWRVGTVGLVESIYQAFSTFITYAKLWELQNKTKNKKI